MSEHKRITDKQWEAYDMLWRARRVSPDTSDGIVSTETFYDSEVHVAYVHWRTARSLRDRGLVTFGAWYPDEGTEITLTERLA